MFCLLIDPPRPEMMLATDVLIVLSSARFFVPKAIRPVVVARLFNVYPLVVALMSKIDVVSVKLGFEALIVSVPLSAKVTLDPIEVLPE